MARSTCVCIMLFVLSILLPPLAVFVDEPRCNDEFFINFLLSLVLWLPGVIHANWVIFCGGKGKLKASLRCDTTIQDRVMDVLVLLCCFILPPLGILLKQRRCTVDAFAAIILCAFFWFPAVIFAILVAFCGLSCAKAAPAPEPKV
ncbi:hypothetical protein FNF31_07781 [Cafeteria roenbergensis]|uniref:Uncharacterized protein n=2 Tax=Cafeteria roenbergensis TaxID=33653 RepID=A0A5A8C164_CAFRO|nr:hypothetical protein FNF31_07781 [Cafeteria roenbergensis]